MPKSNNKTDKAIPNKPIKASERRPSTNSSLRKDTNQSAVSKEKILLSNLIPSNKNNSIKNQKQMKIIDNSLDNEDAKDLIDSIQVIANENNYNNLVKNIVNNIQKNKTENADSHDHLSINEVKITPNINAINNLIADSQQALSQQKILLENFSELNKKLSASEFEVQKLTGKLDNKEFAGFSYKYSECLDKVIEKLKKHSEEKENIKCKI